MCVCVCAPPARVRVLVVARPACLFCVVLLACAETGGRTADAAMMRMKAVVRQCPTAGGTLWLLLLLLPLLRARVRSSFWILISAPPGPALLCFVALLFVGFFPFYPR